MPGATGYLPAQEMSFGVADMPSAPLRFLESWIQAVLGFVVCIVLPILVYAQAVPFADGIGVAERTIIATALAYVVVVYCGSRLEAFPGASLMDQAAYIAPIVTVCFATIGVALLGLRLEYSRVQFFGSGFLVFVWVLGAAHLRVRLFTRSYAVVPAPSLATMPGVKSMTLSPGPSAWTALWQILAMVFLSGSSQNSPVQPSPACRFSIAVTSLKV